MADSEQMLTDAYVRLRGVVRELGAAQTIAELGSTDNSTGNSGTASAATLPSATALEKALAALPRRTDADYLAARGVDATLNHLLHTLLPALNGQNLVGRYYGFVTGSTLPVAEAADNMVTALDQNPQSHLPSQTASTSIESTALAMLADVLGLEAEHAGDAGDVADASTARFGGRTLTTGATASNVLGLAMGREHVVGQRLPPGDTVAELGLLAACRRAGVADVQVLTSMGHSSLFKAASIVGLGRSAVVDLPYSDEEPWRLDLDAVERTLQENKADGGATAYIIAVSAGEVNTGRFATTGGADMRRLRALADAYGAWLHVDAALGLFACALPSTPEFARLREHASGLYVADSITSDAHKLLNVPYDAGIFYSRHPQLQHQVFQNANAAYLGVSASPSPSDTFPAVPSPNNMGIENSRRFRALPVYAVLLSDGAAGIGRRVARMVRLARGIQRIVRAIPAYGTLGTLDGLDDGGDESDESETFIGVLFWATDDTLNAGLADRINASREVYVSPTVWRGRAACRIAVSSWRVVEADLGVVERVLKAAVGRTGREGKGEP